MTNDVCSVFREHFEGVSSEDLSWATEVPGRLLLYVKLVEYSPACAHLRAAGPEGLTVRLALHEGKIIEPSTPLAVRTAAEIMAMSKITSLELCDTLSKEILSHLPNLKTEDPEWYAQIMGQELTTIILSTLVGDDEVGSPLESDEQESRILLYATVYKELFPQAAVLCVKGTMADPAGKLQAVKSGHISMQYDAGGTYTITDTAIVAGSDDGKDPTRIF